MCPKLRSFDQWFALVRTTRAFNDLRLYRILLTADSVVPFSGDSLVTDGEVFAAVVEEGDGPAREMPALRHCQESYFRNVFCYIEFAIWPTVVAGGGARVLQQHGPS